MGEPLRGPSSGSTTAGLGFRDPPIGNWGSGGASGGEASTPLNTRQVGLWALLATLGMLFAGFTSAYLVRRAGLDWQPIPLPTILWFNTGLLLSSSLTFEAARSAMRRRRTEALRSWLLITTFLGLAFLAGQLWAWHQLRAQGVYLPTSPHSSFFYMLTGVHGVHLLGGIFALLYALSQLGRSGWTPNGANALNLCATYWHFVDGVWVYLFLLMFVG